MAAAATASTSGVQSVNDFCRMCKENLRIKGNICNSQRIFEGVPYGKRVDQRLAELGLNLVNTPDKSIRICLKCLRLVGRHEITLATIRGWQEAEEGSHADQSRTTSTTQTSAEAESVQTATLKRDRVRTPSKLRAQPPTPTGPPSSKVPRPASEGIDRPRQSVTEPKPGAVPSLCQNSGPEDPVETSEWDEPVDNSEVDQLETHDGPNSYSEESRLALMGSQNGPVPSGASCSADSSLCSQRQPKTMNRDLIKEKAALLKKKGKFPVNEKRLLQLFSRKCPSCGGKLKMHKVTRGVTITFNQLCIQCDYTYQWKSWVDKSDSAAENQPLTGAKEVNSEAALADEASSSVADVPEVVSLIDEESDSMDQPNVSSNPADMDSDEDLKPAEGVFPVKLFHVKPKEESKETFNYSDYYPSLTPQHSRLCTDCGRFFDKRRPHICEHKLKPFSCNICGKRCVNEVALNFHSRIHDTNYEFRCKYCHVTFKLRVDKYIHEQIHMTQGKPYKCPDCSETFATSRERRIHLEDHRGTVDLKCRFCGIEFFRPLSIQRHLLVHTGEKPYKCTVCQRGFNQAGNLKSHMRLHTGERPFKCQHCDKCFNHNVSLKSHLQRYHGVSSEPEPKKQMINKSESDTDAVQSSGNKGGTDSELDTEEEEENSDDEMQMEGMYRPKSKWKSTGRPKGRPKSSGSNAGMRKSRVKRQMRKKCTDEESEEAPSNGNSSPDSTKEKEKRRKKAIKNTARSRRSNGKNIRKRRGRQRK